MYFTKIPIPKLIKIAVICYQVEFPPTLLKVASFISFFLLPRRPHRRAAALTFPPDSFACPACFAGVL